jgi:hypothetical protein
MVILGITFIFVTFSDIIFTFIVIFRTSSEFFNYLRVVTYQRRNKGNPLWNQLLIGGYSNGAPFLGYVDLIGNRFVKYVNIYVIISFFLCRDLL